jgi:hypothetical protein
MLQGKFEMKKMNFFLNFELNFFLNFEKFDHTTRGKWEKLDKK